MTTRFDQVSWVCDVQSSITMSGGGSGSSAPANTTSNDTNTIIQQAPAYSQQYISNLLGQAATSAAQPYQQFPGQQVAGLTPDQLASFSQVENLTGNGSGGAAAAQGTAANSLAASGANTANNISGAGSPYLQASAMYNPAAAASPYAAAAAQATTPQGISSYMSPYLQNDISGLETQAQQNWNQFTAPGVNNSFISAGQAGSGRNEQVLGQQANLANQALTGQIGQAENAAYTTAGQQAGTAASNLSGLGSLAGTTAASEAANLQNIGTGLGNLAATQAGAQGSAASNLANTANTVQNTGITGASALQDVGQQQQNQAQTNINTAMSNFNAQNLWPETQESFMNSIINGLPSPGSSSTSAGQVPTTSNMIGSTSPLGSLAGSLIGAGAVATGAQGGLVKRFASGGMSIGSSGISGDLPPDDLDPNTLSMLLGLQGVQDAQGVATMGDQSAPPPSSPLQTSAPPDSAGIQMPFNPPPDLSQNTVNAANDVAANAVSSPIQPPSTSNPAPDSSNDAPITSAVTTDSGISEHGEAMPTTDSEQSSNPLSTLGSLPQLDANKMRQYQLLSMAKGFLTPAHSGAEALGNAFGNYAQSGSDYMKWQAEQQQRALQFQSLNAYRQGRLGVSEDAIAQRAGRPVGQISQLTQMLVAQGMKPEDAMLKAAAISKGNISSGVAPSAVTTPSGQIVAPQSGAAPAPAPTSGTAPIPAPQGASASPTGQQPATNPSNALTGESYLQTIDPADAARIRSIYTGREKLTAYMQRNTPLMNNIYHAYPDFNSQSANVMSRVMTGKDADNLQSINTAIMHINTGKQLVNALNNGDMPAFNKVANWYSQQTGKPAVTNFDSVKNVIGDELTKSIVGGDNAESDRKEMKATINAANSPQQLSDAFNNYEQLMAGRIEPVMQRYTQFTHNNDFLDKMLLPQAKEALAPLLSENAKKSQGIGGTQPQGAQQQSATPSAADMARAELARRAAARQQQGAQ